MALDALARSSTRPSARRTVTRSGAIAAIVVGGGALYGP
jgi:hypothetical protein